MKTSFYTDSKKRITILYFVEKEKKKTEKEKLIYLQSAWGILFNVWKFSFSKKKKKFENIWILVSVLVILNNLTSCATRAVELIKF